MRKITKTGTRIQLWITLRIEGRIRISANGLAPFTPRIYSAVYHIIPAHNCTLPPPTLIPAKLDRLEYTRLKVVKGVCNLNHIPLKQFSKKHPQLPTLVPNKSNQRKKLEVFQSDSFK